MASREESVDISIAAALIKIGQIEKALEGATKASVSLSITAAETKIKSLGASLDRAMKTQTVTLNTTRAAAQIAALNRELGKATSGTGAVDLSAVQRGRATEIALAKESARQQEAAQARVAAAADRSAEQQVAAARRKEAQIQAVNQRLATLQRNQAAATDREEARASSQSLARQRATLSAQLSQVRSLQNIGQQLTFGLTLPIAAATVAVTKLSFGFEDTINKIRTLTTPAFSTSKKAVDDLRASILSISAATGRGPVELAKGFFQIASAGIAGSTALDVLKSAAQGAAIGLGETNTIANISSSVLNAYGDSAGNAFQITNTLAEAVRIAKGEASEFAPVLGRLLPVAKNLGISFSDVAGSVALLTRNGLSASEATTQVRGLLNAFIKPSIQARKELDRVGLSSTQLLTQLQAGDFIGVLTRIKTAFGTDQLGLGRLFRNQQGLNAFLSLTRDLPATTAALNDVRRAAEGTTKEVQGFSLIKTTPTVQFRFALATLQVELLKIGATLGPLVVNIAKFGATILGFLNGLPAGARNFALLAVGALALAGPLLLVFTAVQRLRIAQQQLALAQGQASTSMDAEAAAGSRLSRALGGGGPGVLRFVGAIGALAAIASGPQLGQGLANAATSTEQFASALGIAGAAAGAFFAGSLAGGPIVGGVAAAATLAGGAIGFFGEQAKNAKVPFDNLRDSLVGVTDEAKKIAILGGPNGLAKTLQGALGKNDKLGQIELGDLESAKVNLGDLSKALLKGGDALAAFNKNAASSVAKVQLKNLLAEIGKGPQLLGGFSDSANGVIEVLRKAGLVKFNDAFKITGITDTTKALDILAAAANKDLTTLTDKLGVPITEARRLTEILGGVTDAQTTAATTAQDASAGFVDEGDAAAGAAVSIDDMRAALDSAVDSANALNQTKIDAFTTQFDQPAAFADLFESINKNKDVIPQLGQQFDITTESGRKQARAQKEITDELTKQIGAAEERSSALVKETGSVDNGTFAYSVFFGQLQDVALKAGFTAEQFDALASTIGGTPTQVFATWAATGVGAAASVKSAIDTLLGAIPPEAAAAVQAIKEPTDQTAALANQLSLLPPETITKIFAEITNADTVDALSEVIQDLPPDTQVSVLAAVQGKPGVDALVAQIVEGLPDEKIATAIVNTKGQAEMDALNNAVLKLPPSRIANVSALVSGSQQVKDLQTRLDGTKGKEVFVTAKTTGTDGVATLRREVDLLHDKSVTVTADLVRHGKPFAKGGLFENGIRKMASGGIRQPMIARVRQGRGILWAEPETMGEAYIPFSMRHRQRAKAILGRTASHFGMMLVPIQPQRAASGLILDQRASGNPSSQAIAALSRALAGHRPQGAAFTGPLIGELTVPMAAQTPQAAAVEVVGAIGARLFDRIQERFG